MPKRIVTTLPNLNGPLAEDITPPPNRLAQSTSFFSWPVRPALWPFGSAQAEEEADRTPGPQIHQQSGRDTYLRHEIVSQIRCGLVNRLTNDIIAQQYPNWRAATTNSRSTWSTFEKIVLTLIYNLYITYMTCIIMYAFSCHTPHTTPAILLLDSDVITSSTLQIDPLNPVYLLLALCTKHIFQVSATCFRARRYIVSEIYSSISRTRNFCRVYWTMTVTPGPEPPQPPPKDTR